MPISNIVPIDQIDACIAEVVAKINAGVIQMREQGTLAQLPEEIAFSMVVVKQWQALPLQTTETGETSEKQSGSTVEKSGGTENATRSNDSERTSTSQQNHSEKDTELNYTTTG